ncbi:MAG TPA: DUF4386 domain-containing protein [Candidatus Limnocylindrales bacterium]|nr:DUF4386 domain-containing protein [Candidatus Limnocylindrales bacterium]
MTRRTNARIAGFTFFFYIAVGIISMVLFGRATGGEGIAAKLAGIAQHATEIRVYAVLILLTSLSALVLGVTLYAITREEDPDLAMLALTCRVVEGVNGAASLKWTLGLLWLATATGPNAPETGAAHALGSFLLRGSPGISATFFAVGSTLFSWLLLRGRMIPIALAWLGVVSSVLLVVVLPLQGGLFGGLVGWLMWLPMLVFEVWLALWLLIKGAAMPVPR